MTRASRRTQIWLSGLTSVNRSSNGRNQPSSTFHGVHRSPRKSRKASASLDRIEMSMSSCGRETPVKASMLQPPMIHQGRSKPVHERGDGAGVERVPAAVPAAELHPVGGGERTEAEPWAAGQGSTTSRQPSATREGCADARSPRAARRHHCPSIVPRPTPAPAESGGAWVGLRPSVEADSAVGGVLDEVAVVVDAVVVPGAEQHPVGEVGAAAAAPGVAGVVGFAPGRGHRAAVGAAGALAGWRGPCAARRRTVVWCGRGRGPRSSPSRTAGRMPAPQASRRTSPALVRVPSPRVPTPVCEASPS